MPADPKASKAARDERAAMRAYLRRKRRTADPSLTAAIDIALDWILTRSQRYDPKPGGLGRK